MPLKVGIKFHMRGKFELAEDKSAVRVLRYSLCTGKPHWRWFGTKLRVKFCAQEGHKKRLKFRISVSKLHEKLETFTRRFPSESSRLTSLPNKQHYRGSQKDGYCQLVSYHATLSFTFSRHHFDRLCVFLLLLICMFVLLLPSAVVINQLCNIVSSL